MTQEERSIFDKQLGQFLADDFDTNSFAAGCYGVEWGKNSMRPRIAELTALLADLLPYFHDLQTGFLEPKTQAAGYDRRTVNELHTRLVEATK